MKARSLICLGLATVLGAQQPASGDPGHPPVKTLPVKALRGSVSGFDPTADHPVRLTLWLHDYRREAATIVGDLRSAADGSFQFPEVQWLSGHDWGWSFFVLLARQGDRVAGVLLRGDQVATEPIVVELKPAVTLRGRVTDKSGQPIAVADVRLQGMIDGQQHMFFAETPPFWQTRTAADGAFAIAGVPPGWNYSVTCLADQFARGRLDQGDGPFDIELDAGATLTGRVVLGNGEPVVRARVCAQGIEHSAWCTARTDEQGAYRLAGLVDDRYNVWVDREELTCAALDSQPVVVGATTQVPDIVAVPGGFFVGRVIDADTGEPLQPGATGDVAIYGPSRPRSGAACHVAPIGIDGAFRIRVAPGSNYIYLRAGPGFEPVAPTDFTLDVGEGDEKVVEFRVRRAGARRRPK